MYNIYVAGGVVKSGGIIFFQARFRGAYFFTHNIGGSHLFPASLVLFHVTGRDSVRVYFFSSAI